MLGEIEIKRFRAFGKELEVTFECVGYLSETYTQPAEEVWRPVHVCFGGVCYDADEVSDVLDLIESK